MPAVPASIGLFDTHTGLANDAVVTDRQMNRNYVLYNRSFC